MILKNFVIITKDQILNFNANNNLISIYTYDREVLTLNKKEFKMLIDKCEKLYEGLKGD